MASMFSHPLLAVGGHAGLGSAPVSYRGALQTASEISTSRGSIRDRAAPAQVAKTGPSGVPPVVDPMPGIYKGGADRHRRTGNSVQSRLGTPNCPLTVLSIPV